MFVWSLKSVCVKKSTQFDPLHFQKINKSLIFHNNSLGKEYWKQSLPWTWRPEDTWFDNVVITSNQKA